MTGVTVIVCAVFQLVVVKVNRLLVRVSPDNDTAGSPPPIVTVTVSVGLDFRFTVYAPATAVSPDAGSSRPMEVGSMVAPRASSSTRPTSATTSDRCPLRSAPWGLLILKPKNSVSSLTSSSVTWTVTVLVVCPEVKVTEPEVPA